jgi:hypothetical protein
VGVRDSGMPSPPPVPPLLRAGLRLPPAGTCREDTLLAPCVVGAPRSSISGLGATGPAKEPSAALEGGVGGGEGGDMVAESDAALILAAAAGL